LLTAAVLDQWTDQRWRLNNLYAITNKEGVKCRFVMNWAQEGLFNGLHDQNIILKARQLGFTTFIQLYMLDVCVFYPDIRAGTIAHTREDAEAFFRDKVKYPYDQLPDGIKNANPAAEDSAKKLSFANNSSLRVGTSLRSGTFQYLHISEYGKICAKYPEKAKEIRTGALNTVQAGQKIFIESTAEGTEGDFYDKCTEGQEVQRRGIKLTSLDMKFFFFPWWKHPEYVLDPDGVETTAEFKTYFDNLEQKGICLTDDQRAWYMKKAKQQTTDDMYREYPSTPEEAFLASVEGAYYATQFSKLEERGRITKVPHDEALKVETWWDLGLRNVANGDAMAIWFVQRAGKAYHVIDYYANSGEGLKHYADMLDERKKTEGYSYSDTIWPHDGTRKVLDEGARQMDNIMAGLGYRPEIVARGDITDGIEAVRSILPMCWFDAEKCAAGLKALKNYRKEWDETRSCFKPKPLANWAADGADAFRTGAKYEPSVDFGGPLVMPAGHVSNNVI